MERSLILCNGPSKTCIAADGWFSENRNWGLAPKPPDVAADLPHAPRKVDFGWDVHAHGKTIGLNED